MPSVSHGALDKINSIKKHLYPRFWRHRWTLLTALVLVFLHATLPSAIVFLIQGILDDALIQKDESRLFWLPIGLIFIYGLNGIIGYTRGMLTRGMAWKIVTDLRNDVFNHLIHLSISWRLKQQTGHLLSRIMNDISAVQYFVSAIITLIQQPLTIIGLLATAFYMNYKLATICMFILPMVAILIQRFGKHLRGSAQNELDEQADLQAFATETLLGFSSIQAAQAEKDFSHRFSQKNERLRSQKMQHISAQLMPGPIVEFIAAIGIGTTILFGGKQVLSGTIQPGELIAFLVAMSLLNAPFKSLSEAQSLWQKAMAGATNTVAMLETPRPEDPGLLDLQPSDNHVHFKDVSFGYTPSHPVLEKVSFDILPGKITAIQGPSGVGKTTISSLLLRHYTPSSGLITINGTPITEYSLKNLRGKISIIQQHPFLFCASAADNISLGCSSSREEIISAAKRADADEFIQALSDGYDTILSEDGQQLSGGQRQRICIARALLRDSPILILDEATSNLDDESQQSILDSLHRIMKDRTVLLISHDPRLLAAADVIVSLKPLEVGHSRIET